MLTVRAALKDNAVTFLENIDLSDRAERQILITFLDESITEFGDLNQQDLLKMVNNLRFSFSNKEIQVLRLARDGMTNKQISKKLRIGHGTVRNYLSSIYKKLQVSNRTGAIAKAIAHGLLE
ncbi:MAG: LuxR C-terminal-related transcriptional regulator [Anaerolineales bacterium]|nr:LuxR C-terminal-related transcriptional regulator [Anaerolineales bacterium]